ncbi:MAG: DHH family phosphoesterase [Nanoarchaeota archaeon]|nr:DHH family phosphoesterase [Nanoarchaeota archaeon]MBU1135067.1 DHH family phosphoesterase [Nanoarchaeota archaeon]MBU2519977.1 DHH family phosphoesterase [Nanoarchaeota archaeon]
MLEKIESMISMAKEIADVIRSYPGKIHLVSHYDCDGITSAAIITKALFREGKDFRVSFVKQLKEDMIKGMSNDEEKLIIFTDLGSGYLDVISKHLLSEERKIIIADHHQTEGDDKNNNLLHINSMKFGMEENVSGAGVAYMIARSLNPENIDLSALAVIGAIGDSQIGSIGSSWGLMGLNKEILKDAENSKKIKVMNGLRIWGRYTRPLHKALEYSVDPYIPGVSESESGAVQFLQELGIELKDEKGMWRTLASMSEEESKKLASGIIKERIRSDEENPDFIFGDIYELLDKNGEFRDANEFATMLNSCGKLGKAYLGIALCINDKKAFEEVKPVFEKYRRSIGKALSWIESNQKVIKRGENVTWIMPGNKISEHIISNVASIMHRSGMLPENKPVFAMADTENGDVKISARASDSLVENGMNLKDIIREAIRDSSGDGGGHAGASGATISKQDEEMFINNIEHNLRRYYEETDRKPAGEESRKEGRKENR